MNRKSLRLLSPILAGILLTLGMASCATSPTGRTQLLLVDPHQMAEMGKAAFVQMQGDVPISNDAAKKKYVTCVATSITAILTPKDLRGLPVSDWEVELFDDATANAFALPGGRIGVNTGLLNVAETPGQLAAVLGH